MGACVRGRSAHLWGTRPAGLPAAASPPRRWTGGLEAGPRPWCRPLRATWSTRGEGHGQKESGRANAADALCASAAATGPVYPQARQRSAVKTGCSATGLGGGTHGERRCRAYQSPDCRRRRGGEKLHRQVLLRREGALRASGGVGRAWAVVVANGRLTVGAPVCQPLCGHNRRRLRRPRGRCEPPPSAGQFLGPVGPPGVL